MATQSKTYTADELWELSQLPEYADKRLELIEGELIEMSPSSTIPGIIALEIGGPLRAYVRANKLGYTTGAESGYDLSLKNTLAPDVGFIAKARVAKLPTRFYQGAPDLAVEVVSPSDDVKDVQRKTAKYIAYGTRLVWIAYPKYRTVDVCRPVAGGDMAIQEVGIDGVIDGEDVVPGFTLAVRDIFSVLDEN